MGELRVSLNGVGIAPGGSLSPDLHALLAQGQELDAFRAMGLIAGVDSDAVIDALQLRAGLQWSVDDLTAVPLGYWIPRPIMADQEGRLSRFAHVRVLDGRWILESALSPWRVYLPNDSLALGLEHTGDRGAFLGALGMLENVDDRAEHWAFHERLFRSRWRWDTPGIDAAHDAPPPPARRDMPPADTVPLPVPDGPQADEPSLWEVSAARKTHRAFAEDPISLPALGALLWRTLRITDLSTATDATGRSYQSIKRPVASGALQSIDTWILTRHVDGLEPAWWWYDPSDHALVRVAEAGPVGAVSSADQAPIFAVLTARHARAAWKYPAWSHALELRDVGVIYHALQLTGAALGLGVWPLGTGSDRTIGLALGIDLEADAPVGEFAVGVIASEGTQTPA